MKTKVEFEFGEIYRLRGELLDILSSLAPTSENGNTTAILLQDGIYINGDAEWFVRGEGNQQGRKELGRIVNGSVVGLDQNHKYLQTARAQYSSDDGTTETSDLLPNLAEVLREYIG